jgi:ketosteroid isomerase-like protein
MPEDTSSGDVGVVAAFNEAINAHDLDRLASLMTEAHRFVDSAGAARVARGCN